MRRLVVLSNRLPLVIRRNHAGFAIREGAGGLVTAIKPLLTERGGAWIGFSGMFDADRGGGWEPMLEAYGGGSIRYYAVTPDRAAYEGYYAQYSNQELWPRFHSMVGKMAHGAAGHWPEYEQINRLFADRAQEVVQDGSLIWIQDYHLMLLPQILRDRLPSCGIGHFLHIPFPRPEVMAQQPHVRELLRGVLGADLLGFHIPAYQQNFADAACQQLGVEIVRRDETSTIIRYGDRRIRLGAFPIGIEPSQLQRGASPETVRSRLKGTADTIIMAMDRLDYTKAIPPRLEGYARLLEQHAEYRENVSLVQLVDVSRKNIPAYQEERARVDEVVERIRQRYPSWTAIFFAAERWKRKEVAGLMRLARVGLVTPRCDGMNLVAKEYVAAAPEDGVLVLSHQAGAAWQLGPHAVLVDGNTPQSVAEGLRTALEMPRDERVRRMQQLKENIHREDIFWWARQFLQHMRTGPDA